MSPQPIFDVEPGVGYEWCRFVVYRHPRFPDRYSAWADSGCSCSYWTPPTDEQLVADEPVTRAQARTDLIRFIQRFSAYVNAGDAVRYLEAFETEMAPS